MVVLGSNQYPQLVETELERPQGDAFPIAHPYQHRYQHPIESGAPIAHREGRDKPFQRGRGDVNGRTWDRPNALQLVNRSG